MKHPNPCFLTTYVQNKHLEVFFGKVGAYKMKYIFKPLQSQNVAHFTLKWTLNS